MPHSMKYTQRLKVVCSQTRTVKNKSLKIHLQERIRFEIVEMGFGDFIEVVFVQEVVTVESPW